MTTHAHGAMADIPAQIPAPSDGLRKNDFLYGQVLEALIKRGRLKKDDRILVVCGGSLDRDILAAAGFVDVTISNLDTGYRDYIAPFKWAREDAENLGFKDGEFDIAIVHMGLHHCYSPHRALLEMLRVSKRGALAFENRDSFLLNVAKRLGLTVDYEIEAVTSHDFLSGGVGNGPIPNFIYRWTERDVIKTVKTAYPAYPARVEFFYRLRLPYERFRRTSRPLLGTVVTVLGPLLEVVVKLAKKQGNEFGFFVEKSDELLPWLERDGGDVRVSEAYARAHGRMYR
jgi:ubiquinone/menaquinone biosynthesis C-methylase UbiE